MKKTFFVLLTFSSIVFSQIAETQKPSTLILKVNSAFTNDSKAFYGITGTVSLKLSPIDIGIGSGLEFWSNGFILPLFIEPKVTLASGRLNPYLFGNFGYGIGKIKDVSGFDKGGVYLVLGIGGKTYINSSSDLLFELGYFQQKAKVYHFDYYWDYNSFKKNEYLTNETYSGLILSIGISL